MSVREKNPDRKKLFLVVLLLVCYFGAFLFCLVCFVAVAVLFLFLYAVVLLSSCNERYGIGFITIKPTGVRKS